MMNLNRLRDYPTISVDVETTGLNWRKDQIFGVALAVMHENGKIESMYRDVRNKPQIMDALRGELPHCRRIINHHMKFDAHFLRKAGVVVPLSALECTMVRAALIDENEKSFSLDFLATKHVGRGKESSVYEELAQMFGGLPTREVQMKNLHRAPERVVAKYATPDPELALLLWKWQEQEIEKQDLHKVWGLEKSLMPVLVEMEEHGVAVDEERARNEWAAMDGRIDTLQKKLDKLIGRPVNANSAPQMRTLFGVEKRDDSWFTDTGVLLGVTETGSPSLGKDALEMMAGTGDERARMVLGLRKFIKAKSFLKDHILGHAENGRVYPNYNQTRGESGLGTGPGRFSVNDPALQQIPSRDRDVASIVRPCFIPDHKTHVWGCGDWEQFEFRWFAHYTNDPNILRAYAEDPDTDYHAIVSKITDIPRNAIRAGAANAKQINLGLVFGMGEGELCSQMGLPYTTRAEKDAEGVVVRVWKNAGPEGKAVFSKYHTAIPGVKQLLERASSIARARGFVKTAMGRHIRFPGRKFTHKAGGLVFQGTSADCMKQKMVELHPICKKMGFNMLLSVHDELDFSIPKKEVKCIVPKIKEVLEAFGPGDVIECRVPIRSSIKTGSHWWDACKKD